MSLTTSPTKTSSCNPNHHHHHHHRNSMMVTNKDINSYNVCWFSSNSGNNDNSDNSDNNNNSDNSDNAGRLSRLMRLRRPSRFDASDGKETESIPTSASLSSSSPSSSVRASLRPHAIALFPGDYGEDDSYESAWDTQQLDEEEAIFGTDSLSMDDDRLRQMERLSALLKQDEEQRRAKRTKWLWNSLKPKRTSVIDERGRSYGRGGRKRAQARVWIQPGLGHVIVNQRPLVEYFQRYSDRERLLQPLVATETCGHFDVQVTVQGGGLSGQAGAIRHGLANALNKYNPDLYRPPLKLLGYLTRDARKVERKKIGRLKARKSPQWVRR